MYCLVLTAELKDTPNSVNNIISVLSVQCNEGFYNHFVHTRVAISLGPIEPEVSNNFKNIHTCTHSLNDIKL